MGQPNFYDVENADFARGVAGVFLQRGLNKETCQLYKFFVRSARMELRIAITATPTSANTAAHMEASPKAPSTRTRA